MTRKKSTLKKLKIVSKTLPKRSGVTALNRPKRVSLTKSNTRWQLPVSCTLSLSRDRVIQGIKPSRISIISISHSPKTNQTFGISSKRERNNFDTKFRTTRPPPFPPNPIRQRVEYPGTSKIIGCDRCEGVCRIPCVNCGGAGHKDCWNCNGDGVVKNTRVHYAHQDGAAGPQSMERCVTEACSICGGRGRET